MRALLFCLLLTSCAPPLVLEGAPCPCSTGWTCCEDASVCVREGASCPIVPGPDVTPARVELGQDRIQRFTTTATGVTWAIEEGAAGGTIDQTGRYRAPNVAGEYHLLARARGGVTRIPITVRPLRLSVLAGSSGGSSRVPVDGVGQLARLSAPSDLTFAGDHLYFFDQDLLRRVDLTTRRVDTVALPFIPSRNRGTRSKLSRSGPTSLLFIEGTCVREFSTLDESVTTFWCNQAVVAVAGDETRLVRLEPTRLIVTDRATRREVELPPPAPPPASGWAELSLDRHTLWTLDTSGTAVHAYDLRQNPAMPVTIVAPSAGRVFRDLEFSQEDWADVVPAVNLIGADGTLQTWNLRGDRVSTTPIGSAISFTEILGNWGLYVLTPDTIRKTSFGVQELLVGKPARDGIEVDGVGGGAGLVVSNARPVTRANVTWLASVQSIRRIDRDGTTTSIPTAVRPTSITVDDNHLYLYGEDGNVLRRIPLGGGAWEDLPYKADGVLQLLGALNDGRIAFLERQSVKFLDPSTRQVLPETVAVPRMSSVSLDPLGGLFGEVDSDGTFVAAPTSDLLGVNRLDFATGRLTRAGPQPVFEQWNGLWRARTELAWGTAERQYALTNDGDTVLVNDGASWSPLVGQAGVPAVREGLLPGAVNTIQGVSTLDNGDVILVDTREHVVLVVE